MIFNNATQEIYFLLSCLLRSYDISILHDIMKIKHNLEDEDNLEWHSCQGILRDKLTLASSGHMKINMISSNPYHESYNSRNSNQFHLKTSIETFSLKGFILKRVKGEYLLPSLKDHISIVNHLIKNFGILDLYNKLFLYMGNCITPFTDLVGNTCIRSIIIDNNKPTCDYQTIAISNGLFIDPVDRIPTLI